MIAAPKLIYIAGPYSAATTDEIEINCQNAWRRGRDAALAGGFPVVPHMSSMHLHDRCSLQFWLDGTMLLMRACDAVLLIKGWERSFGTKREVLDALDRGLPVFGALYQLTHWLNTQQSPDAAYEDYLRRIAECPS
jgi:hypothetical protein